MAKKKPQKQINGQPKKKKPAKAKRNIIAVPIVREYPEGQVGLLANSFAVQHDGQEFHLLFFQDHPPMILGETEEEVRKAAEEVKSVKSSCLAHLIVSAERFPSFIQAMQDNLEKYDSQQQEVDTETKQARKGVK